MALQDPLFWRSKILLAAIEATYGTDAAPTGAANAIQATNVKLSPMNGSDVSRDLDTPWMGAQPTIPAELHMSLSFDVELAPSGAAGTAPAWGPLVRGCGCAETISAGISVTYNPVSDGHEAVTFYIWIGATLYKATGARGSAKLSFTAQGVPKAEFTFQGLYVAPADAAPVTPDLSAFAKPLLATMSNTPTFTIGGTALVLRTFALDLGNKVENRFLIGRENVMITDRAEMIDATVEATPLAYFDPFALAGAQTASAVQLVHGTTAGAIATLDVPTAQMQRPQDPASAQGIVEWPLRLVPLPAAGNDQWTLTLT